MEYLLYIKDFNANIFMGTYSLVEKIDMHINPIWGVDNIVASGTDGGFMVCYGSL